jgi:hypothetical protein
LGKAAEWFRKAAEQDSDEAQFSLGYCYENGRGVEADRAQAEQWYRKAADQGHRKAKKALDRFLNGGNAEPSGEDFDIMAAFRQATRGRGWQERSELLRAVSQQMGYQRLGPKIRETLEGHLRSALQRKIIEAEGDLVRACAATMDKYDHEDFRGALCSVMRPTRRYERDEVIQGVARYFGFVRVTENVLQPVQSAINSAIQQGIMGSDGNLIWREGNFPELAPDEAEARRQEGEAKLRQAHRQALNVSMGTNSANEPEVSELSRQHGISPERAAAILNEVWEQWQKDRKR